MNLDDINFDFDFMGMIKGVGDIIFRTIRIIFVMFLNLPTPVKITMAIVFILLVMVIGYLTWRYREEWRYVKY